MENVPRETAKPLCNVLVKRFTGGYHHWPMCPSCSFDASTVNGPAIVGSSTTMHILWLVCRYLNCGVRSIFVWMEMIQAEKIVHLMDNSKQQCTVWTRRDYSTITSHSRVYMTMSGLRSSPYTSSTHARVSGTRSIWPRLLVPWLNFWPCIFLVQFWKW